MSGNYPDLPSARIPYDRDGSGVFYYSGGGAATEITTAKATLNGEGTGSGGAPIVPSANSKFCVVFPRAMDLKGYFVRGSLFSIGVANGEVSTDTTNGFDGTWTSFGTWVLASNTIPDYRTAIQSLNRPGIRGIRFNYNSGGGNGNVYNIHLYGLPSVPSNRVAFWRPDSDAPIEGVHLDWGDRPRDSSLTRQFRIKNLSSTLTATDTVISMQALTDQTTPASLVSQHTFRFPAGSGSFTPTVTIAPLAPGQISDPIEIKQTLLPGAVTGLWTQRLIATPTTWT